jgi:hypothetical protein
LLATLGGLLAIAGTVGAIVVGPDNAVQSEVRHLESPGAAIVTAPGAIDFAGPTLRLEAKSSAGPVFIGVGAQVDVEDMTSDLTYTRINEIALRDGELQTTEVQGSQDLLAEVASLDWWVESSEGDIAVVAFALPDDPVSVVAMNADGSAPVDVVVAAELSIRGLFWGLLAAALIGVGLLNLAVLSLLRGRARRRVNEPAEESADPPASEGAS